MPRSSRRRGRSLAVLALLAALLAGACSAPAAHGPGRPPPPVDTPLDPQATLTVGTITVPTGFDPHRERQAGERPATFLLFDRLTRIDATMTPQPMLATGWAFSPDGLALTLTLRQGVTFHDGAPFNADAVRAGLERATTLKGSTSADELAAVTAVTAEAPDRVRLDLSAPRPELPALLAGPAGAMISPRAIASGRDLAKDPGDAGTGAYLLEKFVPNEDVVLVRAPGPNWDPQAGRLARIDLRFVSDDRTRDSALRAGELDVAYVNPFDAGQVKQAEALGRGGRFVTYSSPSTVLSALLLRSTVLTDRRVREAVVRAVDRDPLVHGLLQDTCSRSDQLAPVGFPGHVPDFTDPYPYDPAEARRLLAAAGHPDGIDLEISYIAGRQGIPEVLEQQLAAVGIRATLTPLTSVEAVTAYRQDQLATWSYQVTPDLGPAATADLVLSPGGIGGRSDTVAALRDRARTTLDPATREAEYQEMNRAIAAEAFFVPFCHLDAHFVASDRVVGFESAPLPYANYMIDLRHVGMAAGEPAS